MNKFGLDVDSIAVEILSTISDSKKYDIYNSNKAVIAMLAIETSDIVDKYLDNELKSDNAIRMEILSIISDTVVELVKKQEIEQARFNIPLIRTTADNLVEIPLEIKNFIDYINKGCEKYGVVLSLRDTVMEINRYNNKKCVNYTDIILKA